MELGCDARGYSRAGNDTMVWYCVVLAGRLSPELEKMREVSSFSLLLYVVVALLGNCLQKNSAAIPLRHHWLLLSWKHILFL